MSELERLSRQELIGRAQRLGVQRPELMTRVELTDEIMRRSVLDPTERKRARGWLGIARDLLASVVEQGLHLPEAAALIRGEVGLELGATAPAPVATVTLAEIYAAQGHLDRAVKMLDQVLDKEPDHDPARTLRDRFVAERERRAALKAQARVREPERAETEQAEPETPWSEATEPAKSDLPEESEWEPVAAAEPEPAPVAIPPAHDSLVLMQSDPGRIRVYWELRPESRRRAERRWPEGRAVIRVVGWRASWDGAERVEHDVEIGKEQDSAVIDTLGDIAAVRAALGWSSEGQLHPFSLACELAAGASASDFQLRWIPLGQKAMGGSPATIAARALEHWGSSNAPSRDHAAV